MASASLISSRHNNLNINKKNYLKLHCLLTDPVGHSSPKFPDSDLSKTQAKEEGSAFSMFCLAQAFPLPHFR